MSTLKFSNSRKSQGILPQLRCRMLTCLVWSFLFFWSFTAELVASHFRGASISASVDSSGILTVECFAAWRTTFIGGVSVTLHSASNTNRNINLKTMSQISVAVSQTGVEYPGGEAFTVRRHVFRNDISAFAPGDYVARFYSAARVFGIVNVGSTSFAVESLFHYTPGVTSRAPVMVPATIDMIAINYDWSQNLFASDPDGNPLSYSFIFGPNNPDWGTNFQIPGLTIDALGQLEIPAASTATLLNESRYAYKVRVTDASGE
ncbi:MAG: hypothetical protein HQL31_05365, partial [Planctomycetes bacterium]|nr:hypothetical protein [Planctomycetota bacterium]